jgi:hypothetical protein
MTGFTAQALRPLKTTVWAAGLLVALVFPVLPFDTVFAGQSNYGRGNDRDDWNDRWEDRDDWNNNDFSTSTQATTTQSTTTQATTTTSTTTATSTLNDDQDEEDRDDWRRNWEEDRRDSWRGFLESIGGAFDSLRRRETATTSTTTATTTDDVEEDEQEERTVAGVIDRSDSLFRSIGFRSADSAANVLGVFFPTDVYDTRGFDQDTTWALSLMALGSGILGGLMATGKVALGSLGSLFG